jgi:hypothetical protein
MIYYAQNQLKKYYFKIGGIEVLAFMGLTLSVKR